MTSSLDLIKRGELVITHRLVDASNATLFGEIDGFGSVIYKPIAGERPLWDFPEGSLADREVAAYEVSKFLELDLVPLTIMRNGPFGQGMVQRWIEVDETVDIIQFGQSNNVAIRLLALFDAIINNTDRKFGHLLVDKFGKLYGCDHGVSFHQENKLRTVIWQFAGEQFTSEEIEILRRVVEERDVLVSILENHLTDHEISAFFERAILLLDAQSFPQPSSDWPAFPWPPV